MNEFLSALSLFGNPDLDFQENHVVITEDKTKSRSLKYFYSDPSVIVSPSKDVQMPKSEVSFEFKQDTFNKVAKASAVSVKRVHQELGGKSSNIILDDVADIEKSVKGGAGHCFLNSGQSCNAPTKMLISAKNYDKAVEVAVATANNTSVGDPNGEFRIGPIANKTQYEKIIKLIEIGIEEGATLVAGGVEKPDGCDKGYFIKPTVFANVTNDMTIAKEEIFGPVLVMIKYDNEDEAINIANDTEYGLAGYIQGEPEHAKDVARKIRAGQVIINGGARGTGAPFGGYKASGNGREHGIHGLEECLETKAVIAP